MRKMHKARDNFIKKNYSVQKFGDTFLAQLVTTGSMGQGIVRCRRAEGFNDLLQSDRCPVDQAGEAEDHDQHVLDDEGVEVVEVLADRPVSDHLDNWRKNEGQSSAQERSEQRDEQVQVGDEDGHSDCKGEEFGLRRALSFELLNPRTYFTRYPVYFAYIST